MSTTLLLIMFQLHQGLTTNASSFLNSSSQMFQVIQYSYDSLHSTTNSVAMLTESCGDDKAQLPLAGSGSAATIKIRNCQSLLTFNDKLSIRIILTQPAKHFLAGRSDENPSDPSVSFTDTRPTCQWCLMYDPTSE
jgi:hypothetical protein